MSSDLIFIVGRQRSGTTVLRDLMARLGAVDCDEIFHGDLNHPQRFYRYVLQRVREMPGLVHPEHHPQLFRDYIAALRNEFPGRKLAMDVKYFGLNLIPYREDVDNSTPFIVNFMRSSKAHVVHVVRRNKLRVHVSEEMAQATGRWSAGRVEHLVQQKPKLHVDVQRALAFIVRLERQDYRVAKMLGTIPDCERLYYDEMFTEQGLFSAKTLGVAERFMAREDVDAVPGNLKMNPEELEQLIENHDELRAALAPTPYGWMLDDPH